MATQALATQQHEAKPSLVTEMGNKYGIEPGKFLETVKATVFPNGGAGVTNEQLAAFLIVARQYDLNPFTRELYAFPGRGNGVVPIVSIDGWTAIINRQKNFDGVEFQDHVEGGKLAAITCRIFRKDRSRPTEITEYLSECDKQTEPWKKWPARMLRHKALIQCARYAFSLSGIFDEDEAERIASTRPNGAIELEPDSPLNRPRPATDTAAPEQYLGRPGAPVVTYSVGRIVTTINGNVTKIVGELKKLAGRPEGKTWTIPCGLTQGLVEACGRHGVPLVEEQEPVAAQVATDTHNPNPFDTQASDGSDLFATTT